jgi:16S rRNA (guanine527-N7)-methyltransferase
MNTVTLPPEYTNVLQQLCSTFLQKNTELNLSALRTPQLCMVGNIIDSLGGLDPLKKYTQPGDSIIDIGTGGGFPFLPLAVTLPDRTFIGLDSIQKKITAIEEIAYKEGLKNVQFICSRCEDAGQDKRYREQFSAVTSRAVAPLNTLLEYMVPLVKDGGYILCWKSTHIAQENQDSLTARTKLHCHLIETVRYTLPDDFGERTILVFQRMGKLSRQYPRAIGIPKKTPL